MTLQQIKDNAPSDASHYLIKSKKVYYARKILGIWHTSYNYDCGQGWGLLNNEFIPLLKPL